MITKPWLAHFAIDKIVESSIHMQVMATGSIAPRCFFTKLKGADPFNWWTDTCVPGPWPRPRRTPL